MKRNLWLVSTLLGFTLGAAAQNQKAQVTQPPPPGPSVQQRPTAVQRIFGPTATTAGVLPGVRRQGLSSFLKTTNAVPRREFTNVSVNPHDGRAEGIVLFAIKF